MRTIFTVLMLLATLVGAAGVTGAQTTDECNGIYDTTCYCPSGNMTCKQNQYCSTYVGGYCIVGDIQ